MVDSSKKVLVFDLDGFLYDKSNDLYHQPGIRMKKLIAEKLGHLSAEEQLGVYTDMRKIYGNTLLGLKVEYGIPFEESFPFVHDINFNDFLDPEGFPSAMLRDLSKDYDLFLLTAATKEYAERFLEFGKVADLFKGVWGINSYNYRNKTEASVYVDFMDHFKLRGKTLFMLEDSVENTKASIAAGFAGAVYLTYGMPKDYVKEDRILEISDLAELPMAISSLSEFTLPIEHEDMSEKQRLA